MVAPASSLLAVDPKPYRHRAWLEFREQILEADGHKCQQCGRGKSDGVVLQVHHKSYVQDKNPWEYSPCECFTLCRGCHGSLHGHIKPRFGWHYLGDNDLGELSGHCEYCGTEIRFEYYIQHPLWEPLVVGTDCCDNLTGTKLASNHTESIKRFQNRQQRFLKSSKWKQTGAIHNIVHHGIQVAIAQEHGAFRITMNAKAGKHRFCSIAEAKMATFEAIENGKAMAYLKKHGAEPKRGKVSKKPKARYLSYSR